MRKGDVVAFWDKGRRAVIHAQIEAWSGRDDAHVRLRDTTGKAHLKYADSLFEAGEAVNGVVLLTEEQAAAAKAVTDEHIARAGKLRKSAKFEAIPAVVENYHPTERGFPLPSDPPTTLHSLRNIDEAGKPDWTSSFERYLCRSERRQERQQRALKLLAHHAPTQAEAFYRVRIRGERQYEVAADWEARRGLKTARSTLSHTLRSADLFMADVAGLPASRVAGISISDMPDTPLEWDQLAPLRDIAPTDSTSDAISTGTV